MAWQVKDPNDILDYAMNWAGALPPGDSLLGAVWLVPAGLTLGATSVQGTKTIAWFSGGTAGQVYPVTCRVTTTLGRQFDHTVELEVDQQ